MNNKEYKTNYARLNKIAFEDYNGYCNRDTWLVLLWLNNNYENYVRITRIINNTNKLQDLSDLELYGELKDFYYGDKINFKNVDIDEVRYGLLN